MKRVLYHWIEMREIEVPDECPTEDFNSMIEFLQSNGNDFVGHERDHDIVIKASSRDWEIVNTD